MLGNMYLNRYKIIDLYHFLDLPSPRMLKPIKKPKKIQKKNTRICPLIHATTAKGLFTVWIKEWRYLKKTTEKYAYFFTFYFSEHNANISLLHFFCDLTMT